MNRAPATQLALITGAGGTLGRALARELTRRGNWYVVAADVDLPAAAATVAELSAAGGDGQAAALDVADPSAWGELVQQLRAAWPRLDLLVNGAGICLAGEVADGQIDAWRKVIDVNYYGALHGCQAVVPWMVERRHGAVLNVASITGLISMPSMAAYGSAKAAIVALSESLHAELQPRGVGVTVAAPGFFPSELIARGDFADEQLREMAEALSEQSTLTAAEVARAALDGVERRRLYVVTGPRARRFWRLKRLAPTWLTRRIALRYHKRRNEG